MQGVNNRRKNAKRRAERVENNILVYDLTIKPKFTTIVVKGNNND